jgi:serine/threonine protein kinase
MLMEYRVDSVLGVSGFGITYLARDTLLEKDVAIKEFFPSGVVPAQHRARHAPEPERIGTTRPGSTASFRKRARSPASAIPTSYASCVTSRRTGPATW